MMYWPVGRLRAANMVAAGFIVLASTGCSGQSPAHAPQAPVVQTVLATSGTIHPHEQLAGLVAPYQNVAIESTLTEPADEVTVQEGDVVHSGELLAQLDTADLRAALAADLATAASDRANTTHTVFAGGLSISQGIDAVTSAQTALSQAQANLTRDQTDLTRYRQLLANGYVSAQQVQQQETTVRDDQQAEGAAQAALAGARSNVTANGTLSSNGLQASSVAQSQATEQVALANAQQERVLIAKASILSPIDGIVVNRNLNPGEYPGSRQIFTLQQVDPIYAVLRGSGSQVADIAAGSSATIVSSDLRRQFKGRVVGVLNEVTPGSTDFQVKVLLQNPAGRLRPGMIVTANVNLPATSGVRVPVTAFTDDNHDAVMIVTGGGTVKTVQVSERSTDGATSVVGGLQAGARVISDGQTSIGDGEKVALQ